MAVSKKVQQMLAADPDTITVELGGKKRHISLSVFAFKLAAKKGFPLANFLGSITSKAAIIANISTILWIGMLPFNEDLEQDEVDAMVGLFSIGLLVEAVTPQLEEILRTLGAIKNAVAAVTVQAEELLDSMSSKNGDTEA